MAIGIQRGLFATHRGRLVKRAGLTFGAVAVGMFVLSSMVNGGAGSATKGDPVQAAAVVDAYQVDTTPQVASAVANPFRAQSTDFYTAERGSRAAATLDDAGAADASSDGDQASSPAVSDQGGSNADTVTVKRSAQSFAMAWGSWSDGGSAADYVASLPGVKPGAEPALVASAKARTGAPTTGSLTGTSPILDSFDGAAGRASVEVEVAEGSLDEGGAVATVTYKVSLERYSGSDSSNLWGVTAISAA